MKHLLLTTIAAMVLVGCGPSVPDISIHNAAIYGQSDLIKEYVKQGKDMNSQDEYGATLLHYSLQSGHTEISKFLVISEADVNIMDKEELTPLDWAHWMNQVETAKLIREYGGKTAEELKAEGE